MPAWVRQEEPNGCVIGSFAMLLGVSYEEAKSAYPYGPDADGYYASTTVHRVMRDRGWKLEYRTPRKPDGGPWPPPPFAPIHMATVLVAAGAPCWHSVVMLADGRVLDPLSPEPRRLLDYVEVQAVVGFNPKDQT